MLLAAYNFGPTAYTFTGMTARTAEKPPVAWTADQVVDALLDGMAAESTRGGWEIGICSAIVELL